MSTDADAYTKLNVTTGPTACIFYLELYVRLSVDHNDTTTITNVKYMLQYGSKCKTCLLRPNRWAYYRFHPTVQQLIYSGLASGYAIPSKHNPFLNTDNTSVPHYGLKYAVGCSGLGSFTNDMYFEIQYKYNITFKDNR